MADMSDLYPGFRSLRIAGPAGEIAVLVGGSGPPLLCLHGYPQSSACWHRIAPTLAAHATLVLMDLRGYGASAAPVGDAGHTIYSKREMARDCLTVMAALGYPCFSVMGHDRGARVAYRLALDHPDAVDKLIILDILPTGDAFGRMRSASAYKSYHWLFLAQPYPMPEALITASHRAYVDHTLTGWTMGKSLDIFDPKALATYRALVADPARVHAICEDYRAGWHVDRVIDEADRAAGRVIDRPTLVLWGSDYVGKGGGDPLDIWRAWAPKATGAEIVSGHFLAEEAPEETSAEILRFWAA
jgi:haloacetate dehalogenase